MQMVKLYEKTIFTEGHFAQCSANETPKANKEIVIWVLNCLCYSADSPTTSSNVWSEIPV